jgi:thymidylate synthase (FAD)
MGDEKEEKFKKRIELIAILQHPEGGWNAEDYADAGARGCFDEFCSSDIQKKERETQQTDPEKYDKRKEGIFAETSGRGHGAVLDMSEFGYSMDNLTRASTLFLCAPQYAAHLQQSLRRATAERGFKKIEIEGANELMANMFELYNEMQASENPKIPAEDARFVLPLNTKTTIQTKLDARELMHLYSMAQRMNVPQDVKDTVEQMYKLASNIAPHMMQDRRKNLEVLAWMPAPQLFAKENVPIKRLSITSPEYFEGAKLLDASGKGFMSEDEIKRAVMSRDEALLANMKHYHFTFLAAMSLAAFHQATRQRTWDQSVEPLIDAVERGEYVIPPKIKDTPFQRKYEELNNQALSLVLNNWDNPEVYGVIPHSLKVYDLIHVNGWNAVHSIGKRTCTEAQWEIRKVAQNMANAIREYDEDLGRFAKPQGITYGVCPEKKGCHKCDL